ncbi:hypothetical protein [Nocardia sp. NPDC057440]|uniref:DUF6197 family protein n=1 Tax=Nocardia sp. NPDC057440 TaxID=3346134 RepID=UPI00366F6DA1
MTTAHDVLGKAIESIEKRGWTRGMMYDYDSGTACALGHIGLALIDLHVTGEEAKTLHDQAERLLLRQVTDPHDPFCGSIPFFNDGKGRTKEDVVLAFKHAMEAAANE